MKNKNEMIKDNFLTILSTMTPEDMAEFISNNGKGPKVVQLVTYAHPGELQNNIGITKV